MSLVASTKLVTDNTISRMSEPPCSSSKPGHHTSCRPPTPVIFAHQEERRSIETPERVQCIPRNRLESQICTQVDWSCNDTIQIDQYLNDPGFVCFSNNIMDQIDLAYPLVIEGESPGFNDSQGSPLTSTVSTSNNEPEVENKAPKTKNTEPKEYQFINEDGKAYRPYTDPSRIRANDAKKQSGTDRRAQVRGVPGEFMHVMKLGMRAGASTHSQPNSESGEP